MQGITIAAAVESGRALLKRRLRVLANGPLFGCCDRSEGLATGDATSSIVAISGMRVTCSMPLRFTEAIGKERLRGFGCLQRLRFRRIQRSHEHVKISTLSIGRLIGGPPPSLDVATSRLPAFARAGREARTLTDAATQEAAEPLPVAAIDAKGWQSLRH